MKKMMPPDIINPEKVNEISNKKLKRLENKKRKILSLLHITDLNFSEKEEIEMGLKSNVINKRNSFKHNGKSDNQCLIKEPAHKKHKLESEASVDYCMKNNLSSNTLSEISSSQSTIQGLLTADEYALLKYELAQRKKFLTKIPRITLKDDGSKASTDTSSEKKIPLFMKDVQHMLIYFLFGPYLRPYCTSPRWCIIEKFNQIEHVNFIVVEGLSVDDLSDSKLDFQFLHYQFSVKVEVINPFIYDCDIVTELSKISISDADKDYLLKKFGDQLKIFENNKKIEQSFKPAFEISLSPSVNDKVVPDKYPRTLLLLSLRQMVVENYPVPIKGELKNKYADYRLSKDIYRAVTDSSPLFSIDCEMCLTSSNENELTRITIVNENYEVIYESLVKPENEIVNYLTKFSGITEDMLRNVNKRLQDVQNDIIKLLPADAILIGHSLNTDLHVLKLMHPYVIDTSVIYNLSGERWRKAKLKTLAWEFLKLRIQEDKNGHDSVEDSITSLKLVKLKLSKSISFGDNCASVTPRISSNENNHKEECHLHAFSLFNSLACSNKSSVIIAKSKNIERYSRFITVDDTAHFQTVEFPSNKQILSESFSIINELKLTLFHLTIKERKKLKYKSILNNWFEDLWKKFKDNSACIVLFVGSRQSKSNGVCFIETKKRPSPLLKT